MGDLITMANNGTAVEMGSLTPALMQSLKVASEADLTDEQFALVVQFAQTPRPPAVRGSADQITEIITAIASVLKHPATSTGHGKLKLAIYRKTLEAVPLVALQAAANIAVSTLEWMPTPAELLKLARGRDSDAQRAHDRAATLCRHRRQRIMDETLRSLAKRELSEEHLASLPEHIARIAETQASIIILMDGTRLYRNRESVARAQEERDREFQRFKAEANEVLSRAQEKGKGDD